MAYRLRAYVDLDWVPEGAGGAAFWIQASNNPGFGAAEGPGPVGNAQTKRVQVAEQIVGTAASPPTSTTVTNALTQLATDLGTIINTNIDPNYGTTILTAMQGWATGKP